MDSSSPPNDKESFVIWEIVLRTLGRYTQKQDSQYLTNRSRFEAVACATHRNCPGGVVSKQMVTVLRVGSHKHRNLSVFMKYVLPSISRYLMRNRRNDTEMFSKMRCLTST